MKFIIAIIQPHKLEALREALSDIEVVGMTVSQARGHGRQKGHREVYRGAEYQIDLLPKLVVEIGVSDEFVERTLKTICKTAGTGKIGDGKIFVYDLEEAVRIRTGEHGPDVL